MIINLNQTIINFLYKDNEGKNQSGSITLPGQVTVRGVKPTIKKQYGINNYFVTETININKSYDIPSTVLAQYELEQIEITQKLPTL